jgi:hypothetical protein
MSISFVERIECIPKGEKTVFTRANNLFIVLGLNGLAWPYTSTVHKATVCHCGKTIQANNAGFCGECFNSSVCERAIRGMLSLGGDMCPDLENILVTMCEFSSPESELKVE